MMRLPVNSEQMAFMCVCGLFNMIILIFRSGASKGSVHMPCPWEEEAGGPRVHGHSAPYAVPFQLKIK